MKKGIVLGIGLLLVGIVGLACNLRIGESTAQAAGSDASGVLSVVCLSNSASWLQISNNATHFEAVAVGDKICVAFKN